MQVSHANNKMKALGVVVAEILQAGQPVSNQAIIARLIQRLELESDMAMLDVYRYVLELVLHKTADDTIG